MARPNRKHRICPLPVKCQRRSYASDCFWPLAAVGVVFSITIGPNLISNSPRVLQVLPSEPLRLELKPLHLPARREPFAFQPDALLEPLVPHLVAQAFLIASFIDA